MNGLKGGKEGGRGRGGVEGGAMVTLGSHAYVPLFLPLRGGHVLVVCSLPPLVVAAASAVGVVVSCLVWFCLVWLAGGEVVDRFALFACLVCLSRLLDFFLFVLVRSLCFVFVYFVFFFFFFERW